MSRNIIQDSMSGRISAYDFILYKYLWMRLNLDQSKRCQVLKIPYGYVCVCVCVPCECLLCVRALEDVWVCFVPYMCSDCRLRADCKTSCCIVCDIYCLHPLAHFPPDCAVYMGGTCHEGSSPRGISKRWIIQILWSETLSSYDHALR